MPSDMQFACDCEVTGMKTPETRIDDMLIEFNKGVSTSCVSDVCFRSFDEFTLLFGNDHASTGYHHPPPSHKHESTGHDQSSTG